jgi:hypothetical protein
MPAQRVAGGDADDNCNDHVVTTRLQTRLASADTGHCGWSMDGVGLFGALPGMNVAAPVATHP